MQHLLKERKQWRYGLRKLEWRGDLKGGQGEIKLGSGAFAGSYSFHSRFQDG
jgi:hypothetical protein